MQIPNMAFLDGTEKISCIPKARPEQVHIVTVYKQMFLFHFLLDFPDSIALI